ncbi:P-type ATPase, partial [Klebsiella pneumoniae]|uniref:P-type ATPase n=1 Tax=Klebsiella pneumoniae TaxID=573 RepID=UPI001D893BBA|nr:heavy metal translocating P-type ATPase [Klebsiella pneumoniae]
RKAVQALSALAPDTAMVWHQAHWQNSAVEHIAEGDMIMVRAGERIALDARVVKGQAAVNQAPITGESMPVDKQPGDTVYAGTIVSDGVIEAQVTATAGHSTLAHIASAIQEAQAQRAPTQRFVDQ